MKWARLLATSFLLAAPTDAAAIGDGRTEVIDRPSGFGALPFDGISDSTIGPRTISADGCYVVFVSANDVLLADDQDDGRNVYRKDRCSPGHPLQQVNVSASGQQPEPDRRTRSPSISANGRYVAFISDAATLGPDADGTRLVWVKDMQDGSVELASRADTAGGQKAADPYDPVISGDGNHVVFAYEGALAAANGSGPGGQADVYVRDLGADRTYLASAKADNSAAGGANGEYDISFDGTTVAFVTNAKMLSGDLDTGNDAYLATVALSSSSLTFITDTQSAQDVALSSDGKTVAWLNNHPWVRTCSPSCSAPADLDSGVDPAVTDNQSLFAVNFGYSGTTTAAAAPSRVFWSTTAPLTAGDTNGTYDAYGHTLANPTDVSGLFRLSDGTDPGGLFESSASDNGALLTFRSNESQWPGGNGACCQVFLKTPAGTENLSQPEGQPLHVEEAGSARLSSLHSLSSNGRYAVFGSDAAGLGVPFLDNDEFREQIFRRDMLTGDTLPMSVNASGQFGNDFSDLGTIDAAGDRVAFASNATDLVAGVVPGNATHLFVRDISTGTTRLLDRTAGGEPSTAGASLPRISGDGRTVVFTSDSEDLPGAPATGIHAYAVDVDSGAIALVDRTVAGTPGNGNAGGVDVSADGSRIAFHSEADNLGGSSAGHASVYLKDRGTGDLTWISRPEDGSPDHSDAWPDLAISGDGQRVAFVVSDPLFGFGSNSVPHVFLRDVAAGTTAIASLGTPLGTDGSQGGPALSHDGRRMSFWGSDRTYVRDLVSGTTTALENGANGSSVATIDPTGTCAGFTASSTGLSEPGYPSTDYEHAYVRAIGGDCPPVPPGGGPGPGPGGGAPDATAPVISGVRVTNKRFRVGASRTALSARRAKRGTAFVFTLSESARTTIAIAQRLPGRKKGKKCVKPRKGLKKRCTRFVAKVALTRTKAVQGVNRVAYTGRTRKGALKPGRYRATLRATDAAGNRSKARTVNFTVVRR